jgi:riboflavin kinase/FMN adenylyltransferase
MKIITDIQNLLPVFPSPSIALGTFDGVHIGHQSVICRAIAWAKQHSGTSIVFTFSNHPLALIHPQRVPPQLLTQADKANYIEKLGVDVLVSIPFTHDLLIMHPDDFLTLLFQRLQPSHIIVGPNYTYGKDAAGTSDTLGLKASNFGAQTEIAPFVFLDGHQVSSTLIRRCVAGGEVRRAAQMLGHSYELTGTVIHGDGRGRTLNYPTANLRIAPELILPGKGVYAVNAFINEKRLNGLCNVGINPTFHTGEIRVEVHLLDFDADLYGQTITIRFIERIRDEKAFPSKELLIIQMNNDVAVARERYFST